MQDFQGKVAVITGGASGFGREFARTAAGLGMKLVLADIEASALEATAAELRAQGAQVLTRRTDVSKAAELQALADATLAEFGAVHLLFNNAGVADGGAIWEASEADWNWVLGVDLWGVIHGVRLFVPMMLEAAAQDPAWRGHVTNTASMAGLLTPPNMGIYNAAKAAVVSLTETLYQDLRLVTDQIGASLLCPYFVPTGIIHSERNRPTDGAAAKTLTKSQQIGQALLEKAVTGGKITAAEVAQKVFKAISADQFYVFSHESPKALGNITHRMQNIVAMKNPADPFLETPEIGARLRAQLRAGA